MPDDAKPTTKHAIDAPRSTIFRLHPEEVTLIDDPADLLYEKHVQQAPAEEFICDLLQRGQINPIQVRKRNGAIEVVAGRHRVLAFREINRRLREAGKDTMRIAASYVRGSDEEMFCMMVSENIHRRDLDPIEKADLAYRYIKRCGASIAQTARLFRVTDQTIRDWGQLLALPEPLKDAVSSGDIKPTAARQLRKLPEAAQRDTLNNLKRSGSKVTVQETRRVARKSASSGSVLSVGDAPPKSPIMKRKEIETELAKIKEARIEGKSVAYATGRQSGWIEALEFVLGEGHHYEL